jgi:hypothetical protein
MFAGRRFLVSLKRAPIEVRFRNSIAPDGENGCWRWLGNKDRNGYGRLRADAPPHRYLRAPRVSWEIHRGPIPEGLLVCHRCDNPECSNPEHLFVGTARDNSLDALAKGRLVPLRAGHGRGPGRSGIRGVGILSSGRFQARLRVDGRYVYLGTFDTATEAAAAYEAARSAGR